jgi:hypothetical protein
MGVAEGLATKYAASASSAGNATAPRTTPVLASRILM